MFTVFLAILCEKMAGCEHCEQAISCKSLKKCFFSLFCYYFVTITTRFSLKKNILIVNPCSQCSQQAKNNVI